jgi:adenylosuccinate synthase
LDYNGAEGKGKIVDFFAKDYDVLLGFKADGHEAPLYINIKKKVVLHQIPSSIFMQIRLI